ncbi:uncharacterized protein MAM_06191 [Metarhizium album ARSEF 1941]|uniref:Uncharacterized protein n=1 Tax=Metarhizium album (strain ARSEF 1941) TaxID=1081103 RepID=A0A0B2WQC6_METAS|nr:uncharacterized protein MAM_06191 [Metarhizium album ARSEF 1941]KHN95829.1 hypothetical protein MAM_06191 [Metarhizium album ARSEF 1941]
MTFSRALALALLALPTACSADGANGTPTPAVTTAPVFIPHYGEAQWSAVRGSIISTYGPLVCCRRGREKMELTILLRSIADLECNMRGTTAATCSGYSSYCSGYTNGKYTGPTEVSWTSTLTGSNIHWGTLTLADKPTETDDSLDVTATNVAVPMAPPSQTYNATPAQRGAGDRLQSNRSWARAMALLNMFTRFVIM